MNGNGGNGHGSQEAASVSHRSGTPDPFASGSWILTMLGGKEFLVQVEGSESLVTPEAQAQNEQVLRAEMIEHRSLCVSMRRKYDLRQLLFPIQTQDPTTKQTGFAPAAINSVCKHEGSLDLEYEFTSHACLLVVTFLSDLHPGDVDRLRVSVHNADESMEMNARMKRSNLIVPSQSVRG